MLAYGWLIPAIIAAVKLGTKVVSGISKSDTEMAMGQLDKSKQMTESTNSGFINRYYKEDLLKYMNFLNTQKK